MVILLVTGTTTFNGNSVVNADSTINGDSIISGDSTIVGNSIINGNCTIAGSVTASEVVSSSDLRLKENINTISDPLSLINDITGVTFNWKDTSKPSAGLIAQEVEKILPELVSESDRGKAVNYNGIIGLLVECVKQQQVEIENLKNSISNPE